MCKKFNRSKQRKRRPERRPLFSPFPPVQFAGSIGPVRSQAANIFFSASIFASLALFRGYFFSAFLASLRFIASPTRPPAPNQDEASPRFDRPSYESRLPPRCLEPAILECGGKRSATPLWLGRRVAFLDVPGGRNPEPSGRFALPARSSPGLSGCQRPCSGPQTVDFFIGREPLELAKLGFGLDS
jgi:hypothetical protein